MTNRLIQFGTSRFLQAHVDLILYEAAQAGQVIPPVTVVQTTGSPERAGRVDAFNRKAGFPVRIRGLMDGAVVDQSFAVTVVDQGISASRDWEQLIALFEGSARWVVSNTGDAGYDVSPRDLDIALSVGAERPASFPAILTVLLWRRWRAGGAPMTILPCELVQENGARLRTIVLETATQMGGDLAFLTWLSKAVMWCDTLVDRIVSEPIEPLGAVAEPYVLWAIRDQPGFQPPCRHPALIVVEDLEPFERLKLHILNLGHTWLAQQWINQGRPEGLTVRAILEDDATARALKGLYRDEIVPGFTAHNLGALAETYVATTLDRFNNPFLDHKLADIAQNHALKIERRVSSFLIWIDGVGVPKRDKPGLELLMAQSMHSFEPA